MGLVLSVSFLNLCWYAFLAFSYYVYAKRHKLLRNKREAILMLSQQQDMQKVCMILRKSEEKKNTMYFYCTRRVYADGVGINLDCFEQ